MIMTEKTHIFAGFPETNIAGAAAAMASTFLKTNRVYTSIRLHFCTWDQTDVCYFV